MATFEGPKVKTKEELAAEEKKRKAAEERKRKAAEKKKREEEAARQGELTKSFLERQYDLEEKTTTEFVKKYRSPEKPEEVVKAKEEEEAKPDKKAPRKIAVKKEKSPAPAAGAPKTPDVTPAVSEPQAPDNVPPEKKEPADAGLTPEESKVTAAAKEAEKKRLEDALKEMAEKNQQEINKTWKGEEEKAKADEEKKDEEKPNGSEAIPPEKEKEAWTPKPAEKLETIDAEFKEEKPLDKDWMEKVAGEERGKKREQLELAVKNARSSYSKEDYKTTNAFSSLKQFLGENLKTSRENLQESFEHNEYKRTLNELLKFQLDDLKTRDLPPDELKKEMGDLVKYFNQDEKIELFKQRTESRAELLEEKMGKYGKKGEMVGKAAGWVMTGAKNFIHWYQKSEGKGAKGFLKGMAKRSVVGAALVGAGIGAAALAGTVGLGVGVTAGLGSFGVYAQRALGGTAAGVGVARMLEGKYRGKEEKRMAGEQEQIMKELENESDPEKIYEIIESKMKGEIDGYEQNLRREVRDAAKRKTIGLAAGCTVGIVLPRITRGLLNKTSIPEYLGKGFSAIKDFGKNLWGGHYFEKGFLAGCAVQPNVPQSATQMVPGTGGARVEISTPKASGGIHHLGKGGMNVEKPKFVDLEVKKGSSLEGTLIKNLTAHGMDKVEAGRTAHIMANTFATEHHLAKGPFSLVHEGTHMKLNPDGSKIMSVTGDKKLGWIEKGPHGGKHFSLANPEQIKSAGAAGRIAEHGMNHHSNPFKAVDGLQHHGGGAAHSAHAAVENMPQGGKAVALAHLAENMKYVSPDTIAVTKPTPLSAIIERRLLDQGANPANAHETALAMTKDVAKQFAERHGLEAGPDMQLQSGDKIEFSPDNSSVKIMEKMANSGNGTGAGKGIAGKTAEESMARVDSKIRVGGKIVNRAVELGSGSSKPLENLPDASSGVNKTRVAEFVAGGLAANVAAAGIVTHEIKKYRRKKELTTLDSSFSKYINNFQEAKGEKDRRAVLLDILKNVRGNMVGKSKKIKSFDDLKKHNANEFLNDPANKREPIVRYSKFISEKYGITPNDSYTLDVWTRRVVARLLSKRQNESAFDKAA